MLLGFIKSVFPESFKIKVKNIWHMIRPPRIRLTRLIESGIVFEITSKTERGRVSGYGGEVETIDKILAEIKPGDVFYDIGSCVGIYSLHAAKLGAKVIAFEPDPAYRKRLMRNIKINRLRKAIKVFDWAVSDKNGYATLYTDGVDGNSPSLREEGSRYSINVQTKTIDSALANQEIMPPDIIKLDIEGAEALALVGMKGLLASSIAPRLLFVEFHPDFLPQFNSSLEECKSLIEKYGYHEIQSFGRNRQQHFFFKK
jgi:FkbM family methyltransferase